MSSLHGNLFFVFNGRGKTFEFTNYFQYALCIYLTLHSNILTEGACLLLNLTYNTNDINTKNGIP